MPLREVHLFPVKSVRGLAPAAAHVGPDGLDGDRGWVLAGPDGTALRAKHHPALGALRLDPAASPGAPRLLVPGGADLADHLGLAGPVRLRRAPGGARQVAPVHVVTTAERLRPGAGDSSRANLVLDLDPVAGTDDPPDELAGSVLRVGEVVLELGQRPKHCAGWFATVRRAGTVRVGDAVRRACTA